MTIEERQKALYALKKSAPIMPMSPNEFTEYIKTLNKMADWLEQEPKIGHWIEEDVFDGDVAYRCSECNELFWIESGTPKDNEYNFCPKCGAKMVEPQESEG